MERSLRAAARNTLPKNTTHHQGTMMKTLSDYCREQFGEKLYKLSLSAGCTCQPW